MNKRWLCALLAAWLLALAMPAMADIAPEMAEAASLFLGWYEAEDLLYVQQMKVFRAAEKLILSPEAGGLEALEAVVGEAKAAISAFEMPPDTLSPEAYAYLLSLDILPSNLDILIEVMLELLYSAPISMDRLVATIQAYAAMNELPRLSPYLADQIAALDAQLRMLYHDVNGMFCEVDEETAAYVRAELASRLPSAASLGLPWDTNVQAIGNKAGIAYAEAEEAVTRLESFVQNMAWELDSMEAAAQLYDAAAGVLAAQAAANARFNEAIAATQAFLRGDMARAKAAEAVASAVAAIQPSEAEAPPIVPEAFAKIHAEASTQATYLHLLALVLSIDTYDEEQVETLADILSRYNAFRQVIMAAWVNEYWIDGAAYSGLFQAWVDAAFTALAGQSPWAEDAFALLDEHERALDECREAIADLGAFLESM